MFVLRRRDFVTLIGGAAVWPLTAWAQQADRVRRIGVLNPFVENDAEAPWEGKGPSVRRRWLTAQWSGKNPLYD
jgi:hypothetical protein